MILEVVKNAQFVFYVFEWDDSVLKFLIFTIVSALVTAASEDRVNNKDRDSGDDEDHMLEEIDNQIGWQVVIALLILNNGFFVLKHSLAFTLLHNVDSVPEDPCFDEPLTKCPWREAFVSAWFHQTAVAADVVDNVKDANSDCDTIHFAFETQIDQKVVVEEIEHGEH